VTDDIQTDHATEKCVGIGGIACDARAIPPNKKSTKNHYVIMKSLSEFFDIG